MRKLSLIVLLIFSQFTNAAEDDPTDQDSDLQEAAQVEPDSNQEIQEDDSEAVIIDLTDERDRIIKDNSVSGLDAAFPVDI
jgi:hypothetical protein